MTTCWSARRALAAYQDGALVQRRARKVQGHVRTCARCQGELEQLRQMSLLLRSLAAPPRPEGYWPNALEHLRDKIQRLPQPGRYPLLTRFAGLLESPISALVPVTLVCVALVNALTVLGLEEEAFALFSTYVLPIVLD